jgi:hypothetical protein
MKQEELGLMLDDLEMEGRIDPHTFPSLQA